MQRAGIESILGLRRRGAFVQLDPCIPKQWHSYHMTLRHGSTRYEIRVENSAGVSCGVDAAWLDGTLIGERPLRIPLLDDGSVHRVELRLG
jgi:cyclic beta-1,2-glucan synthetase